MEEIEEIQEELQSIPFEKLLKLKATGLDNYKSIQKKAKNAQEQNKESQLPKKKKHKHAPTEVSAKSKMRISQATPLLGKKTSKKNPKSKIPT